MTELMEQRKAVGLSQQELASRAGCSIAMVRLLEGGYRPSPSRVLTRIAAVLNDDDPTVMGSLANTTPANGAPDRGSG